MMKRWLRRLFYATGRERLLGSLASAYVSMRKRKPTRVFFEDGVWVHRSKEGSVIDRHVNHRASLAEYERVVDDYWFSFYTPKLGDTILDIGACKGEEAYTFSKRVGASGRVISVEAHPQTFRCLKKLCQYNALRNVTAVQVAICEKEVVVFIDNPKNEQISTIVGIQCGFRVQGIPLDDLVKQLGLKQIAYLKMNIEGAEGLALAGMQECIRNIRVVCICCHDFLADTRGNEAFRTKALVKQFLQESGFRILSRDSDPRPYIRDQVNAVNERPL